MKTIAGGGSGTLETAGDSTNFVFLSEGCVSYILSHTSPRDACTASSICRGIKCLANSDAVWERFLPSDYQDIISRSVSPVIYSSKKELYFRLCDSTVLLDDGNISFSLNKHNGKKCFMLGAKVLSIAWHDTLIFWRWRSVPESRFSKVAELLAVCWLEIKGKLITNMLSSETHYAAYLVYKIGAVSHGLDFPAKTWVKRVCGSEHEEAEEENGSVVYLTPPKQGESVQNSVLRTRADGWMEMELGKFYNEKMEEGEVEMGFKETQQLHWKSGLVVEGIDIRPVDSDGVSE